jgi:hypothetical protein
MKTIIKSVLCTAILLMSCGKEKEVKLCDGYKLEEPTLKDSLDYEIINTILNSIYGDLKFIHINQNTDYYVNIENLQERLLNHGINIDTLTLQNYNKRNDISYIFANNFNNNTVNLLGKDESECLFTGDDAYAKWENYYKKYNTSSGIYTFKRPGFSADKNKAIIEYSWIDGADIGEGYVVILEKVNNKWKIIHYFVTWVS